MFTLTTFKLHALKAIRNYESRFTEKKPMNAHRAKDVLTLYYILETDTSSTLDTLMEKLETYLQTIKTGWWIFKTGNSRLKDNLTDVFKAYKNPLLRCTHASLGDMSESYDLLKETFEVLKQLHPEATETLERTKSASVSIPMPTSIQAPPRLWESVHDGKARGISFFDATEEDDEATEVLGGIEKPSVMAVQPKSNF